MALPLPPRVRIRLFGGLFGLRSTREGRSSVTKATFGKAIEKDCHGRRQLPSTAPRPPGSRRAFAARIWDSWVVALRASPAGPVSQVQPYLILLLHRKTRKDI
jgi:hypothetical protein